MQNYLTFWTFNKKKFGHFGRFNVKFNTANLHSIECKMFKKCEDVPYLHLEVSFSCYLQFCKNTALYTKTPREDLGKEN